MGRSIKDRSEAARKANLTRHTTTPVKLSKRARNLLEDLKKASRTELVNMIRQVRSELPKKEHKKKK